MKPILRLLHSANGGLTLLVKTATPFDSSARMTLSNMSGGSWCSLPVGVKSLLTPTPAPTRPPTPIPFSCRSHDGVTVTEVNGLVGSLEGLDVSYRLTNTCNEPVTLSLTAIAYRPNGSILNSEQEHKFVGLCLNPGQSQVETTHLYGSIYENLGSVDIEVVYERARVSRCQ